jgi:hypothetical protein
MSEVICIKGVLTDEGIECQALRTDDNELYTLIVDKINDFQNGERVYVCGTLAEASFCTQGKTIVVSWISSDIPKCSLPSQASNVVETGSCYRLSDCKGDILANNVTKDDCFGYLGGKSWKKNGATRCWEN